MDTSHGRGQWEAAAQTRWIAGRLAKMQPGEVVEYAELSRIASCDVRNGGRGYLTSARRMVLRDHDIVTETLRTVGVRRTMDEQMHTIGDSAMEHITRTARRANVRMSKADIAKLPDDIRSRHLTRMAQLGVVQVATTAKMGGKIAALVAPQSTQPPPLTDTLKALVG